MGQNPEFYLEMKTTLTLIFKFYTDFTITASNLTLFSMYLTNIKLELRKDGRILGAVAQFNNNLFHKRNKQCLQRKLNTTYAHFDG